MKNGRIQPYESQIHQGGRGDQTITVLLHKTTPMVVVDPSKCSEFNPLGIPKSK